MIELRRPPSMAAARPARARAPALQLRDPPRIATRDPLPRAAAGARGPPAAFPPGTRIATVVAILHGSTAAADGFLVAPIAVGAWELDPSPPRPATPLAVPPSRVHLSGVRHSFHPTSRTVWLAQAPGSPRTWRRRTAATPTAGAFGGFDGIILHPLTPYGWPIGRTTLQLADDARSVDH